MPNEANNIWWSQRQLLQDRCRYLWASKFCKDKDILEVGCAHGYGSQYFKDSKKMVGIDISWDFIKYAMIHFSNNKSHFIWADAQLMPFRDESFDVIIALSVIEHLKRYKDFIEECKRVLKKNGLFICSTPNKQATSPNSSRPYNPEHVKEFYLEEFRQLLERYFDEVHLYGQYPTSKLNNNLSNLITKYSRVIQKILQVYVLRKIVNFVTNFIFRDYHLEKMNLKREEIRFPKNLRKYEPFVLPKNQRLPWIPKEIIGVAKVISENSEGELYLA